MTHSHSLSRLPNHTLNKDSKCVRITGEATLGRVKKKQCGSNCSKETNIGSGWERKSIGQRFPFTSMIRMESWPKNQTDGRKATSPLRTSFQKLRAVTSSSSALRSLQRNGPIGRLCTVFV